MMTEQRDWLEDFGLDACVPPRFFSSVDQINDATAKAPQPHALRRAFDQLGIHGVLCREHSPVIYFRQVKKIEPSEIIRLHRSFWNQGVAPILVIVAPDAVHVYSGLIHPETVPVESGNPSGFVEKFDRVRDQLQSFLLSVESGEYFHAHRKSFDPLKRVDRSLLRNLQTVRQKLGRVQTAQLEPHILDALLCRLVFTCYLFDRDVVGQTYLKTLGIEDAKHVRDILAKKPWTDAKAELYRLFDRLRADFNGDLFNADLEAESRQIKVDHVEIMDRFFHGMDVQSGQQTFWPYDFGYIPIETISAIYEYFLKAAGEKNKRDTGAFYTPRFLAEFILDVVLHDETSLLNKRFLDPACGSGIFLVGLFNRLAEEWKLTNPGARYDRRANGLMDILRNNIHGVDRSQSACQITAFSLYLAFLDQLSPPDIQKLLGTWDRLPYLVSVPGQHQGKTHADTIRCADFFSDEATLPWKPDIIVGNPPWGSDKNPHSTATRWCSDRQLPHPDRQMAIPFIWKAPSHLADSGKVCFVLPHGILFNHNGPAIRFQQRLFHDHAVDCVVNLTDYQNFLFEESRAPALVIKYRRERPDNSAHCIEYWAPKVDWATTQAEIMSIQAQDRTRMTVREVLDDLDSEDAPLIWKKNFWATPRDWRLLNRLSLMPRLQNIVAQAPQKGQKRWFIAEGFQPFGANDPPSAKKLLELPDTAFIKASDPRINLFLLPDDCTKLSSSPIETRRFIRNTSIFKAPHVLIAQGFSRIAFADFDVSFQHALRGVHGPISDSNLLIFLAAYLRSNLAKFFLFHTSSNWGVNRNKVHVHELLRLPFPLPEETHDPQRCQDIVNEIAEIVTKAAGEVSRDFADREGIVRQAQENADRLINEYFDVDDIERMLIADTANIIIPSFRPSRAKTNVPTIIQGSATLRKSYLNLLCGVLNGWARQEYIIQGKTIVNSSIGVGLIVLEKTNRGQQPYHLDDFGDDFLNTMNQLQHTVARRHGVFELIRGLKVFHNNLLFITKPLGQRYWSNTAALNDADEIATTLLGRGPGDAS